MAKHASLVGIVLGGATFLAGCAPVFSDLQSAKLVGRDQVEVTPGYTGVFSEGEHVQDEFGLQFATGLADRVDLRVRYTHVEGVNVVGLGPKVSLLKDRIAVAVPVGFAFGSDVQSSKTWQIHPTLLLTAPVDRHVELNVSGKVLVPFSDSDTTVAFNVGLGLGNLERWAIRPEFGMLFDPGQSGHYTQFSIGFTYFGGPARKP